MEGSFESANFIRDLGRRDAVARDVVRSSRTTEPGRGNPGENARPSTEFPVARFARSSTCEVTWDVNSGESFWSQSR